MGKRREQPSGKGLDHACYEYLGFLRGAFEMTQSHPSPLNIFVQDATLMRARVLAEFLRKDEEGDRGRRQDDLRARDYVANQTWSDEPFYARQPFMDSLNKSLAHLTSARILDEGEPNHMIAWDGFKHLHGTVCLIREAWGPFEKALEKTRFKDDFKKAICKAERDWNMSLACWCTEFENAIAANPDFRRSIYPGSAEPTA